MDFESIELFFLLLRIFQPLACVSGARFENPLQQCCAGLNGSECGSIDQHGKPSYTLCEDPSRAFFWDRVHLSQAGWAAVFQFLKPTLQRFLS
ncbi:hypothetical protein EJ110_NYTH15535 [Nymphaea thermarum]|nr:hypothetical protein EJ110_NYTH15535 [Nymphaea thermarum]